MTTLNQSVLKIVISFNSTRTKSQITNFLTSTIWPKLETKINTVMNNNFDAGWNIRKKLKVNELGNNSWEIYPKFIVSGNTNLTAPQLKTGVSNLLANLKTTLKDKMVTQGATDIKFHVHYLDGRAQGSDEF